MRSLKDKMTKAKVTKNPKIDNMYSPKKKIEGGKVLAKVKKDKKFKIVNG